MAETRKKKDRFLYREFSDQLKKEIGEGRYKPGQSIPSERELVERHRLSRTTVRSAILQLIREGWLYSRPGSATFVSEQSLRRDKGALPGNKHLLCLIKVKYSPLDSPYYSRIFWGMQQEADRRGYYMSFCSFTEESKMNFFKTIRDRNAGGVVLIGGIEDEAVIEIHKSGIPLVLVDNYINRKNIVSVLPDNFSGAFYAVKYLTGLGHREIYFVGASLENKVVKERFNGYKEALVSAGIDFKKEYFLGNGFSISGGYHAAEELIKKKNLPGAILAVNDEVAIGIMNAINEKSDFRIPRDISIIGFDDIAWASHSNPPLSTVKIEKENTGALAIKLLSEHMESESYVRIKVVTPTELIIRSSCSVPPKK